MKTFLLFIIGILLGGFLVHVYDQQHPSMASGNSFSTQAETGMRDAGNSVGDKLAQWHLTSDDIKADLAQTGKVVRAKAQVAGDKISDARIATVIKAKYVLDRDISAMDISVSVDEGHVTLAGRVASAEIIGRAMELALDTDGVVGVVSQLTLRPLN
jgi:hypothetical protein